MTSQEKIAFKNMLKKTGELLIRERIEIAQSAINNAQEAANSEGKSSAGDKYEVGRAMGHLEKNMYAQQKAEHIKELDQLQKVQTDREYATVQTGAFVICADHSFFIAAGLGKQVIGDQTIFFLSPHAPLAKQLQHKKAGDTFLFNKAETTLLEVY